MTVSNGSFEESAGPEYVADDWTIAVVSSEESYAAFAKLAGDGTTGTEIFERGWGAVAFITAFEGLFIDLDAHTFDSVTQFFEDFENEWGSGTTFIPSNPPLVLADFGTALVDYDDFEDEWPGDPLFAFTASDLTDATFSGETFDDIEEGWGFPIDVSPTFDLANFQPSDVGPPVAFESFNGMLFEIENVTADPSSDELTTPTDHNLANGWRVRFRVEGGTLPGGLVPSTFYFVRNVTATTFEVSATASGSIIDITDSGSGTIYIGHDPDDWWVTELEV